MKKTLVEIVKDILSDLDGEDINSISDTVEALQVAKIVEQTFNDIVLTRAIPEHETLLKLTALSNSEHPTHFVLEDSQARIKAVWYDCSSDNSFEYRQIRYLEPFDFIQHIDKTNSSYVLSSDVASGTKLRIGNDRHPTFFTSFDDKHIVMDSFDVTVDTTLRNSKVRAFGTTFPVFSVSDAYIPELDVSVFPYLIQEAKSRAFSVMKGAVDQKTEQAARRAKVFVQNDQRRVKVESKLRNYGRR
jgi:hypothetical protein